MADAPVPSLARAREQKINELSVHFANDDLSLEDLERRIEQVYKAASVAELESITADLVRATAAPAEVPRGSAARVGRSGVLASSQRPARRVLSLMSSTRRVGRWTVPQKLDVLAIMSDTRLDLTHALLPAGVVDIEVRAVMASLRLIVPPGMRVVIDTHSVMANIQSRADDLPVEEVPATLSAPVLRLSGYAFMADVQVVVRRREEPYVADDE